MAIQPTHLLIIEQLRIFETTCPFVPSDVIPTVVDRMLHMLDMLDTLLLPLGACNRRRSQQQNVLSFRFSCSPQHHLYRLFLVHALIVVIVSDCVTSAAITQFL